MARAAALEAKQLEQFNAMLQNMPEVQGILNAFKQMVARWGHGGVHEVADNQKASIGDVALQESQKNADQVKVEAMASTANLPSRPTNNK